MLFLHISALLTAFVLGFAYIPRAYRSALSFLCFGAFGATVSHAIEQIPSATSLLVFASVFRFSELLLPGLVMLSALRADASAPATLCHRILLVSLAGLLPVSAAAFEAPSQALYSAAAFLFFLLLMTSFRHKLDLIKKKVNTVHTVSHF